MAVKELTKKEFDDFIKKGNSVVDFWAMWCGPCKMMKPHFEAASKESKGVKFGKVNVENEDDLAQKYGVMSIPALLFFKNGKQIDQTMGAMSKADIIKKVKEVFK
jgi:thioredoxin 1